ncbi:MAG: hypothetical protein QXY45_00320 [Candidatus Aenigmatarchaeota archaeon]
MIISEDDRDLFISNARFYDTADLYMKIYGPTKTLPTIDGGRIINVNTFDNLRDVCQLIGCELP